MSEIKRWTHEELNEAAMWPDHPEELVSAADFDAVVQERDTLTRRVQELEAFVRQVQTWPSDDIQGVRYHAYQLLTLPGEAAQEK